MLITNFLANNRNDKKLQPVKNNDDDDYEDYETPTKPRSGISDSNKNAYLSNLYPDTNDNLEDDDFEYNDGDEETDELSSEDNRNRRNHRTKRKVKFLKNILL